MAEHRHYAEPHPHWVEYPKNLPAGTKINDMSPDRKIITPQAGLDIDELDVPARDGHAIRVRRYTCKTDKAAKPVLVYLHGGGYVKGGLETDDDMCRAIAATVAVIVLSVEYRLAPEYLFPTGFQDCHDVVRWTASHQGRRQLNADLTKGFLLGGTSAGSNFTSGIAHLAVEEKLETPLTGLILMAPSLCHWDVRPAKYRDRILSIDEIEDSPGLTAKSVRYFAHTYGAPPADKRYSPLLYNSNANLAKKAFVQICGWDPRRDEGIVFSELLEAEDIPTRTKVYSGLPHGFWQICPSLPESQEAIQDLLEGVAWLLDRSRGL